MNQINEYFVNLDKSELSNKNVIIAKNINNKLTVLIKNLNEEDNGSVFLTDYLQLRTCVKIYLNDEYIGIYHVIVCLTDDEFIIYDFKKVLDILIIKAQKKMSSFEVLNLFNSINNIFKTTEEKDNRELQIGLYGELITLKYLYNLGYLNIIEKWHTNFSLKFDIELNKSNRIEIKTTTNEQRIHTFNHNQLCRKDVTVYIVSCLLEKSELGLSLGDLIDQIIEICHDLSKINILYALKKRCGINDKNDGMIFNETLAYSKLKLYEAKNVPQIIEDIPDSITHIKYDVDLTSALNSDFSVLNKIN